MSEEKKLTKSLEELNANIQVLSKVTALTLRKDSLFKGKETKQEQIEVLEEMKLPDDIIALIIGSTIDSVKALRSQRRAKAKKKKEAKSEKKMEEKDNKKTENPKQEKVQPTAKVGEVQK